MKYIQGTSLTGYVTILVKGTKPELFFQKCSEQGIAVWDIEKKSEDTCSGNVKLQAIPNIRRLKRGTSYQLSFIDKHGFPFLFKKFMRRKQILIALLLSVILVFCLSNIIWEIRITGVPKDIEEKISEQLNEYGIYQGTWTFTLDSPSEIQQNLINDIPELLWVGVERQGTSFLFEGVEKTVVEEEEVDGPRNLVANKTGVIENMYVSKGRPRVQVNDYVEPGDVLVSGELQDSENGDEEEEDETSGKTDDIVAAEGDITAKTWYETEVTVPLDVNYEQLTGNTETKYHLKIGDTELPIWGFGDPEFSRIQRERQEKNFYFFKWKLPISLMVTTLNEKTYDETERDKDAAVEAGIRQARKELQLKLGPEAKIVSDNVLQETVENGKVKLILYMSVEEDIVKHEPIDQGD